MKILLLFLTVTIILSCSESSDKRRYNPLEKGVNKSTTSYDSLYKSFDCNSSVADSQIIHLEIVIDSTLKEYIKELEISKKDTTVVNPLIELFREQYNSYKSILTSESELIYWSYGKASLTGERIVASTCYYLKKLQEKYFFIKALHEKIQGTLLNLPM